MRPHDDGASSTTGAEWTLTAGHWVFPVCPKDTVNQYVDFLHAFDSDHDKSILRISADTDFVVWLNGVLLGGGQYSNYPDRKTYEEFDLARVLQKGANALAVTVFYNGRNSSVYRRGKPGLVFEILAEQIIAASGTDTLCRKNPCYHSGPIAIVSGQLAYTFGYDARGEDGFVQAGYAAGGDWRNINTEEATLPEGRQVLSPRPVKRLVDGGTTAAALQAAGFFRRERFGGLEKLDGLHMPDGEVQSVAREMHRDGLFCSYLRDMPGLLFGTDVASLPDGMPVEVDELKGHDGVYLLLDMGQEEVGHLELEITAPAGTMVDLGYGEHLDDLRVRTFVGGRSFASRYICREGRQQFRHPYLRWAGRYLALHVHGQALTLHTCHLRRCPYPVEPGGFLETGNPLEKRILEVARRTLHLCMHEHYEDTPWREQALYANDARTQALCGYYAFGEYAFPASSFALLGEGLRPDGFLELTAPAYPKVTIPSFTLVWMLAVRDHFLYSGDDSLARRFLPQIRSMLDRFLSERDDNLLPLRQADGVWHFYDWSGGMSGYSKEDFEAGLRFDGPLNFFLILALEAAVEMAAWCGQRDDTGFSAAIQEIRVAARERFYDRAEGVFSTVQGGGTYTALTQALALLSGTAEGAERIACLERLNDPQSGLLQPGLSQSFYTFEARMLDPEGSGQNVLNDIQNIWGDMLAAGATTFWETERGARDFNNAGSLCHAWSAVPLYVYYKYLLGVRPLKPGFEEFALSPLTGVLPRCKGAVGVAGGEIRVDWQDQAGMLRCRVSAPAGCRPVPGAGVLMVPINGVELK